jgi:hypothetical protein
MMLKKLLSLVLSLYLVPYHSAAAADYGSMEGMGERYSQTELLKKKLQFKLLYYTGAATITQGLFAIPINLSQYFQGYPLVPSCNATSQESLDFVVTQSTCTPSLVCEETTPIQSPVCVSNDGTRMAEVETDEKENKAYLRDASISAGFAFIGAILAVWSGVAHYKLTKYSNTVETTPINHTPELSSASLATPTQYYGLTPRIQKVIVYTIGTIAVVITGFGIYGSLDETIAYLKLHPSYPSCNRAEDLTLRTVNTSCTSHSSCKDISEVHPPICVQGNEYRNADMALDFDKNLAHKENAMKSFIVVTVGLGSILGAIYTRWKLNL